MYLGKKLISLLLSLLSVFSIISIAQAKSVYVISDTGTWETDTPIIQAYRIQDSNLVYQTNYNSVHPLAIGLAIDTDSEFLFVTHEKYLQYPGNVIELVNAKTMEYVDTMTATGASNLAGIVVDQGKQKVYVMDRQTNHLYVYSWDAIKRELSLDLPDPYYVELQNCYQAYGLALDEANKRLYVADNTTSVKYYDANDPNWSKLGEFTVTDAAIGIAIDLTNQYVYTGNGTGGGGNTYLSQYDLSADPNIAETTVDVNSPVLGIAVDQQTSLVYITTYGSGSNPDRLIIYDANLVEQPWESGDIGNPAGVAVAGNVSYKPALLTLSKIDDVNDGNCVSPGDYITYKITYGPNGVDHNNVVITDYLPCQVGYINPSDPNYDDVNHTYKWQIGSLSASAPNDFVTLTVYVNLGVEPNGIITNYCEIESNQYLSFAFADTNVCFWSPDIIYVDVNAVGCDSGLSWEHADPDLQRALQKAQAWDVNQIWVAKGTYKPTNSSVRSIFFELLDGVAVYGGFPSSGGQRNPNAHHTILSGDIGIPGDANDNSYHVVRCEDVNNAILDGFTITGGKADGSSDDDKLGGGIYCKNSHNVTITRCIITGNSVEYSGGGLCNNSSDPHVTNCIFTGNTASWYGGGMHNYASSPTVANCIFSGNASTSWDGGGMFNYQSSPTLINCTFSKNSAGRDGGGIHNINGSSPTITYCIFSGNLADYGGAVFNNSSDPNITNCIFTGNVANHYGGGIYNYKSSGTVDNCIFSGNISNYGGGISNDDSEPNIINCIFTGNSVVYSGGGLFNNSSDPHVTNCIFTGNTAGWYGGGMHNYQCLPVVINCIFCGNYAGEYGGGMCNYQSSPNVTNCIFWDNNAYTNGNEIYDYDDNFEPDISYSDIKGGWAGDGNIDEDPCFFDVEQSGSWTADASFDSSIFQSTLTDAGANRAVNQLAGKFVNPKTTQHLQFFIVSNDADTIKVWSDVTSITGINDTYEILDYHLSADSNCIDAGDPNGDYTGQSDIDGEPRVFDGDADETEIVDMGADEYYWSPADFNNDGLVNFFDYALFASAWQSEPNDDNYNEDCDLEDNNSIDYNDLALFCEDWLWQTAWAKAFPCSYGQGMGRGMGMGMSESLSLTEELYPSAPAKQAQPELTAADIEEILKWLEELWLTDDEVRKMISEDEWLKFMEDVNTSVKEQIYN